MSYIDINKISYDSKSIRSFKITNIDDNEVEILDVQLIFQKNRAIVFNIISNCKYINQEIKNIRGQYYHYSFFATIYSIYDNGGSISLSKEYEIIVDSLEFSKKNEFFINSNEKWNINIFPSKNLSNHIQNQIKSNSYQHKDKLKKLLAEKNITAVNYQKDKDFIKSKNAITHFDSYIVDDYIVDITILNRDKNLINLLKFDDVEYKEYDKRLRYLLELYSFIFETPILIDKIFVSSGNTNNILFQSQNISENAVYKLEQNILHSNWDFSHNINNYLDNFVLFKKSKTTLDLLLNTYLLTDMYNDKNTYHLNDISGFIDLFDGIFTELGGEKEKKEFICSECKKKKKTKSKIKPLNEKINFVLDKLEPELKKYKIDKDGKSSQILASFRHMIRHQKSFNNYNISKISSLSKGVLRLYMVKHVLKVANTDYDINRILLDFNIYTLYKHAYKYNNEEIFIYSAQSYKHEHKVFSKNRVSYLILKEQDTFKNSLPNEFIYQNSSEIKKIYIDDNDKIKRELIHSSIVVYNNCVLNSKDNRYKINMTYDELTSFLNNNIKESN